MEIEKYVQVFYAETVLVCSKLNKDRYPPYHVFKKKRQEDFLELKEGVEYIEDFIATHLGTVSEAERKKLYFAMITGVIWYLELNDIPRTSLQVFRHLKKFDDIMELNFPGYYKTKNFAEIVLGRIPEFPDA